jgi:DNA-binding LacI/PurR family transcriptional regulator
MPQQIYCTVGGENVTGGLLATQHLLGLGHQRVAFLGDVALPEVMHRFQGYQRAHEDAGLTVDPALLISVPFDASEARAGITRLCERGVSFDAVFACSDVLASATTQALAVFGRRVPDDVAVVGYDDIEWASHSNPPLTTVRQPIARAGVELVDALLRTIDGERVQPRSLPVELIVRASTRSSAVRMAAPT